MAPGRPEPLSPGTWVRVDGQGLYRVRVFYSGLKIPDFYTLWSWGDDQQESSLHLAHRVTPCTPSDDEIADWCLKELLASH